MERGIAAPDGEEELRGVEEAHDECQPAAGDVAAVIHTDLPIYYGSETTCSLGEARWASGKVDGT